MIQDEFKDFVLFGINLFLFGIKIEKSELKFPSGWKELTSSKYHNEKNYAILTGELNNILVVDLDINEKSVIKECVESMDWYRNNICELMDSKTLITKSPRNGYHIFFKYNSKIKTSVSEEHCVDIRSTGGLIFQGERYDIINSEPIRELSEKELEAILNLQGGTKKKSKIVIKKDRETSTKLYEKANQVMKVPSGTEWDISKTDNGIKAVPGCRECLINTSKEHSTKDHSALFINNDKSVIKSCFSCGTENVVYDDVSKDIAKIFPQETFQTMVTGGKTPIAVKRGDGFTVNWEVPLLYGGNHDISYYDKGQISRRVMVAKYEKLIQTVDITLKEKICKFELPQLIYKCLSYYKKLLDCKETKDIWSVCPEYFVERKEELKMERNPLFKYLKENTVYEEGNVIRIGEIRDNFSKWLGSSVRRLDNGTFVQVDSRFKIGSMKVCKHCKKESRKGCCEKYKNDDRTMEAIVINMKIV
jgi:hypothetical protein